MRTSLLAVHPISTRGWIATTVAPHPRGHPWPRIPCEAAPVETSPMH